MSISAYEAWEIARLLCDLPTPNYKPRPDSQISYYVIAGVARWWCPTFRDLYGEPFNRFTYEATT